MERVKKKEASARDAFELSLRAERAANDAQFSRVIKRDTDIINGLLREIDALYLLLQKQRKNSDPKCEDSDQYIHDCQDMRF